MNATQTMQNILEAYAQSLNAIEAKSGSHSYWGSNDELSKVKLLKDVSKQEVMNFLMPHIDTIVDDLQAKILAFIPGTRSRKMHLVETGLLCEKSARKAGFGTINSVGKNLEEAKPSNRQAKNFILPSLNIGSSDQEYVARRMDTLLNLPKIAYRDYRDQKQMRLFQYMRNRMAHSYRYNQEPTNASVVFKTFEDFTQKAWRRAVRAATKKIIEWFVEIGVRDAFTLAMRTWGRRITVSEFNRIADNYEVISKIHGESPRICIHALRVSSYLGVSKLDLSFLGNIKKSLHEKGLNNGGWKLLQRIPQIYLRNYLSYILTSGKNDAGRSGRINFFVDSVTWASAAQIPDAVFNKWIMACESSHRVQEYQSPYHNIPQVLFRGLPELTVRTVEEANAFINEYNAKMERLPSLFKAVVDGFIQSVDMEQYTARWGQVSDYLAKAELGTWGNLPEKITWAILWKRQADWHEAITAREKAANNRYSWTSLVKTMEDDEWVAEALDDGGSLWEEGKAMHHCVSSYAHYCRDGNNRIYSIKKNGDRYATLQIQRTGTAQWKNVQLRGYCNATIKNPFVLAFADSIAEAYSVAERKQMDEQNAKALKKAA